MMMMKRCFLLTLLTLTICLGAKAQSNDVTATYNVPKAEFSGKGEEISSLFTSSSNSVEKVYLYCVGTDRFLNAGGYWGTEAASFTVGLPITMTRTSTTSLGTTTTYYTMQVSFANSGGNGEGNTVGWVTQHGNTSETNYSPAGFFLDRSSSTTDSRFTFTRVTDGFESDEYVYTVRTNGSTSYYMYDGGTDLPNKLTTAQDNIIYSSTTNPTDQSDDTTKKCGLWKIITQEELTENFANTYDHTESPSDASFLIRGQNFNRMNSFSTFTEGTDAESDKGWYAPSTVSYTCAANTNTMGASDITTEDAAYGMFYCCAVTKATEGDEIKQRVTCPKQGWYRIDLEGFYHDDTYSYEAGADNSSIKPLAEVFGRVAGQASGHPDKLTSVNTYNTMAAMEDLITDEANKITTMKAAGQAFYYDYYPHHLMLYVAQDNTDIELGVRFLRSFDNSSDGNYVAFDDAELKFLGTEVVLSEKDANINPNNVTVDFKRRLVMLERSITPGVWNTITLPFDVTKEATQAAFAFGVDVQIAEFKGFDGDHRVIFNKINLNSLAARDVVMQKDKCYLIKCSKIANSETFTSTLTDIGDDETGETRTVDYYYLIERVSFNKKTLRDEITTLEQTNKRHAGSHKGSDTYDNTAYVTSGTNCNATFCGLYEKRTAPVNAYVTDTKGDWFFLTKEMTIKGFRCWLEDEDQTGQTSAKRHNIFTAATYIDGVNDETTRIADIEEAVESIAPAAVFDLSGRRIATLSPSEAPTVLPKGIYIIGGKKVAVK